MSAEQVSGTLSKPKRKVFPKGLSDREMIEVRHIKNPNGCWEWIGSRDIDGYGQLTHKGRRVRAHRLSFQSFTGPIPIGMLVLHHCDNPPCVNPAHLYAGDQFQNESDKRERGRGPAGENNVKAKLSTSGVAAMRRMYAEGNGKISKAAVGRAFGVTKSTSTRIINSKLWIKK